MIAPNLIIYTVFVVIPVLMSLVLAFTDWNFVGGFDKLKFVGLKNFTELPGDKWVTDSLRNNLRYMLVVPITMAFGLLFALMLNRFAHARGFLRSMVFCPYITSSVAIAAVWLAIFHPSYGPISAFLQSLGIENPPKWLGSPQWALPTLMMIACGPGLATTWSFTSLVCRAFRKISMRRPILTAPGRVGAKFRYVIFPLLTPTYPAGDRCDRLIQGVRHHQRDDAGRPRDGHHNVGLCRVPHRFCVLQDGLCLGDCVGAHDYRGDHHAGAMVSPLRMGVGKLHSDGKGGSSICLNQISPDLSPGLSLC